MNVSLETPNRITTPGIHTDITIESLEFVDVNIKGVPYKHVEVRFRTNAEDPLYYVWNTASTLYGTAVSIDEALATDAKGNLTYTIVKNGKVSYPGNAIVTALHKILIPLSTQPKGKTDEVLELILSSVNAEDMVAKMQQYLAKYADRKVQIKLVYSYHSRDNDGKVQRWLKEDKNHFVSANHSPSVPPYNEKTDWVGKQDFYLEFHDPTLAVRSTVNGAGGHTPPGMPPGASTFIPEADDDLPFTTQ